MTSERWREIEELYHAAQRREQSLRSAFLAEACHGDDELKGQIEALLAQDSRGKILDGPAAELLTGAVDHPDALSLSAGDKLGPYEISGLIGAGGMGEVYRARDPRLSRDVAIKVSQERFSDRFQREARAVAALNHPNICTLHDVGPNYLVMELIDGKSPKGPLPLEEVLRIARQIAGALEAAHEKGIVHRDLKPLNIRIKPDGTVKILDFGLAKNIQMASSGDPRSSPTESVSLTRAGMILGTAAYMSPEQARGKTVDKRADIWAFGLVLHELITGRVLFQGDDITETLAAVVKEQPDLSDVPERVRPLLEKCLEKDRRKRLRDIGDFELLLGPRAAMTDARRRAPWMPWLAAALFAGLAAWAWIHTTAPPPRPVTRWTIPVASPRPYATSVALSRDGTRLAYVAFDGTLSHIMLRMMDQLEAKPIPGSEGVFYPIFSPDGQWLVYISGPPPFKVKKIPVTGGTPITLCDGEYYPSIWGEDDTILLGGGPGKGLFRLAASGGAPQTLTTPDAKKGEMGHWRPFLLPGGQAVLFTILSGTAYEGAQIAVLDLKKGSYRVLGNEGADARYVSAGHLVYARGGTLFAVPFDMKRMAATGTETPVVEGIALSGPPNSADYAVADSGLLVYRPGVSDSRRELTWANRKGAKQSVNVPPQNYRLPRVSPDGQRAAIEILGERSLGGSGNTDIWIIEPARGTSIRLTSEGSNVYPIWTRDGRRVAFVSMLRGANSGIYWAPADGSGKPELLLATASPAIPTSWTADSRTLFYTKHGQDGKLHSWMLAVPGGASDNKPRPFLESSFNEGFMVPSPDGQWVAYQSDETGRYEIYVRPFPGPGGKTRISTLGGRGPRWYGREIFYRTPVNELAVVDVQTSPTFRAGLPQILFKPILIDTWDVAPDGRRILLVEEPKAPTESGRLEVVTDWFEELRRRVPLSRK